MPHVLRSACALVHAGVRRVVLLWKDGWPPDLARLAADPRLAGAELVVLSEPPDGADDDAVLVVCADRVFHRELPRAVAFGPRIGPHKAELVAVEPRGLDAGVWRTSRRRARELAIAISRARVPELLDDARATGRLQVAYAPRDGFSLWAGARCGREEAERLLVEALRPARDGVVARLLIRPVSLFVTRMLMRRALRSVDLTRVGVAIGAVAGVALARGRFAAALTFALLLVLGVVLRESERELARLRYQTSRADELVEAFAAHVQRGLVRVRSLARLLRPRVS